MPRGEFLLFLVNCTFLAFYLPKTKLNAYFCRLNVTIIRFKTNNSLIIHQNYSIMKKKVFYLGGLILAAVVVLIACNKTQETTVNKFFNIQNASLVAKAMPESTSSTVLDVLMNSNVIAGGSSFVTVNSPVDISKVMVGVRDQFGYYELVPNSRAQTVNFTILVNQSIDLGEDETFPILVAIVDNSGKISEIWEHEIKLIEVGTGTLQVSLSFNQPKDVDLHLYEPNGEHIYYGNHLSSNGGELDLDSNAGCSIDNINNENITYGEEAYVEPGTYRVYVDMWSNCSPQDAPTTYTVTVFYGGALIAAQTGTNPFSATFPIDEPSNHGGGDIDQELDPVITFVIPDNGQKKTKSFDPQPLTESAKEQLSME